MKAFKLVLPALLCCAAALPAGAQEQAAKPAENGPKAAAAPAQPSPEQAELTKLSTENQLADQRLKKKLGQLNSEKEELKAQYELELQRQKSKAASLEAELAAAAAENKLADEKNKKAMAELAARLARLKAENDVKAEQQRLEVIADSKEKNEIELAMRRMDLAERRLKFEKMELESRMSKLTSDLDLRAKKAEWKKESNTEPVYTDRPLLGKKLVISDRRIALNGPIYSGVGDYVAERINYYNNISTQPIFIVIDYSPGGSVQAGYQILKAMESSKAPVNVVVKSMAASMAAVIATMAEKSYVYPNAVILHHQMMSVAWGNMTQMKEQLELAREWDRRINVPVAKKMGVSLDEFRKKMYEKNSDGDWQEFGDKAVDLKWVTGVVEAMEETGVTKDPDQEEAVKPSSRARRFELEEKVDEKGQRFMALPRLEPFDFYYIYNPDKYYR